MHEQYAREVERRESARVDFAILHEHQPGPDQVNDVTQLGVILAHQRVGR